MNFFKVYIKTICFSCDFINDADQFQYTKEYLRMKSLFLFGFIWIGRIIICSLSEYPEKSLILLKKNFLTPIICNLPWNEEVRQVSTKSIIIAAIFYIKYELSTFSNASFVSFPIKAFILFRIFTVGCLSDTFIQTHKPIDCVFVSYYIGV